MGCCNEKCRYFDWQLGCPMSADNQATCGDYVDIKDVDVHIPGLVEMDVAEENDCP